MALEIDLDSDHNVITFNIKSAKTEVDITYVYNIRKTNWDTYLERVDESLGDMASEIVGTENKTRKICIMYLSYVEISMM